MRILTTTILALLATSPAFAKPIVGRASVIDGDTLEVHGTRIRLHGIDAPEGAQLCQDSSGKDYRCGQLAAQALAERVGSASVSCEPRDTDQYGRTVAVCRLGNEDLNGWLVSQGQAMAYQRYSDAYVQQELTAKALKRGIWAGTFQEPQEWRRAKREQGVDTRPAAASRASGGCQIKGNISRKGEKVYHLPGTRDYERTRIDEAGGERMFCSEDEAKAAGWRPARG